MSLALMIVATVAWFWKGYIELAIVLMAWAIWIEAFVMNAKLIIKASVIKELLKKKE